MRSTAPALACLVAFLAAFAAAPSALAVPVAVVPGDHVTGPAEGTAASAIDVVPGRFLVKLAERAGSDRDAASTVAALAKETGLALVLERRSVGAWVLVRAEASSQFSAARIIERLQQADGVVHAEPERVQRALRVPNDPLYRELWGMAAIEAPAAWDMTLGLSSQRIGVVDTGLARNHVDIANKDVAGWDFVSDASFADDGDGRDADYSDEGGESGFHGSHVAGTIAASANDGVGVAGVNWQAGLVTARALGALGGSNVDVVEAAWWLAGGLVDGVPELGADRVSVINLSLGSSGPCGTFESEAYQEIIAAGVVVVAAAGNSGNAVPVAAPADCPGVIAVGAFSEDFYLASYSNFSARLDVMAPGGDAAFFGENILSVDGSDNTSWIAYQGTSMATPHVTGVVSLMQAVNPDITPAEVREILRSGPYTCADCGGVAMLDASDAVQRALAAVGGGGGAPADGDCGEEDAGEDTDVGACPEHATRTEDGEACYCLPGYVVDASGAACVPENGAPVGGGRGDGEACGASRGHWDCAAGFVCDADDEVCIEGDAGETGLYEACRFDADCDSGICEGGLCTRPCDGGCDEGFACVDGRGGIGEVCVEDELAGDAEACSSASPRAVGALAFVLALCRRRRLGARTSAVPR